MDISIIIPFYNSGAYIHDAIKSVESSQTTYQYEVIIVDDGSTDTFSMETLEGLKKSGYNIIHQKNGGPAAARNFGVRCTNGEYLLFLDSDNKIRPDYIQKAVDTLKENNDFDILYCKPSFFGEDNREGFSPKPFDIVALLGGNYIDMCSVISRKAMDNLGGFDENRILIGHEDWELWIRAAKAGYKFYYLQEVLFDYRLVSGSLITQATVANRIQETYEYIFRKHAALISEVFRFLAGKYTEQKFDEARPLRSFLKHLYRKFLNPSRKKTFELRQLG